ncbi:MAG: polysaccharide biosynthesis protein [Marinospirillum sp.]|nr:polysaccharide biosynthesis protein [Marinospirillum sp.]
MLLTDLLALPLALWSGFALRFAEWWPQPYMSNFWWLFIITPLVGVLVFARLGLYRAVVRFMGVQALWAVVRGAFLLALLMWAGIYFYAIKGFPRSVPINFALVTLIYVGGTRLLVRAYYQWLIKHYADKEAVLIYGAGGAGVQLAVALNNGREFYSRAFIDDDPKLWGSVVQGLKVYPPHDAASVLQRHGIARVLLAIPNANKQQRKKVLDLFADQPVHVQTVPSMPEIVSGEASVDQLREVELEDLLGRDPVPPREELLAASIHGKVVMVTGAGGSIGSELCRQIVRIQPRLLLLFEISEFSLYSIEQELNQIIQQEQLNTRVLALLGSVCNRARVEAVLRRYDVATLYHAAAYKHVPMVEHNVFEGIRNNVLGTQVVAESALKFGVERCILVSTDKAVRPTNVMGATKRFAELILQDLASCSGFTIFSMVRFGNVLGSSGSVVPLFRKQIAAGGPVTVTHPEITRFFMTIPEASLLVIQAGSMAKGGDVFVLDMGEPVKIEHLARRMIQLSGLEVKDEKHPEGDIEVVFSGLRPGEKLYEELLIGDNVSGTQHPKIMRAEEETLTRPQIDEFLYLLAAAEQELDCWKARAVLEMAVGGFKPSSDVVDHLLPPFTDLLTGKVTPPPGQQLQ